uniref:Palmitoyltransferase n=1 Tax=Setaria digitata TaxID=48799 RepID=A0A915Q0G9_9BILA
MATHAHCSVRTCYLTLARLLKSGDNYLNRVYIEQVEKSVAQTMVLRYRKGNSHEFENNDNCMDLSVAEYQIIEAPDWNGKDIMEDLGKTMFQRFLHWGPLAVICITLIIGATTTYVHLQWWPLSTVASFLDLSLFLLFNYLTLINLSKSAFFGPGYVPCHWKPPRKEDEERLQYCRVCDGFKIPRSHHCSKCGRCVCKMDHHCPWINNCVGHRNHALFVRFLASATLGCIHAAVILSFALYRFLFRVWYYKYGDNNGPMIVLSLYSFIFVIFAFGLALGVIISVGFLLGLQIRGIARNRTGIEDYIVDKANVRERDGVFIYPYDLGWRRNISDVLLTWNGIPKGNGIWWPVIHPATQFTFSEEQLLQKKYKRDNAHEVEIMQNFSGGYCSSLKFGICIWFCQPWSDEPRQPVRVGEHWMVTRVNKHWFYGTLLSVDETTGKESDKVILIRGWFPRICARKYVMEN